MWSDFWNIEGNLEHAIWQNDVTEKVLLFVQVCVNGSQKVCMGDEYLFCLVLLVLCFQVWDEENVSSSNQLQSVF